MPLLLTRNDVTQVLDMADCIDELAPGQCEDWHWEGCLFEDLEALDTCS